MKRKRLISETRGPKKQGTKWGRLTPTLFHTFLQLLGAHCRETMQSVSLELEASYQLNMCFCDALYLHLEKERQFLCLDVSV